MAKRMIGGLIAALRKADGMTQNKLAECLNVSDKEEIPTEAESAAAHDAIEWYDANGNAITGEEARTRVLEDANGTAVCTYIQRNETVFSIRYTPKDGTVLTVRVITNAA